MIEDGVMKTKVIFDEKKESRYLLTKEWEGGKPTIAVILLIAGIADNVIQDVTTTCVINCVSKLGYGGVEITNLFSRLDTKIETDMDIEVCTDEENDKHILESAIRAEVVVLGWGKVDTGNKKVKWRVSDVMDLLEAHKDKLYVIGDEKGQGYSVMFPKVRNGWKLVKLFEQEEIVGQKEEKKSKVAKGNKASKTEKISKTDKIIKTSEIDKAEDKDTKTSEITKAEDKETETNEETKAEDEEIPKEK